jgi:hypothetical protein
VPLLDLRGEAPRDGSAGAHIDGEYAAQLSTGRAVCIGSLAYPPEDACGPGLPIYRMDVRAAR